MPSFPTYEIYSGIRAEWLGWEGWDCRLQPGFERAEALIKKTCEISGLKGLEFPLSPEFIGCPLVWRVDGGKFPLYPLAHVLDVLASYKESQGDWHHWDGGFFRAQYSPDEGWGIVIRLR